MCGSPCVCVHIMHVCKVNIYMADMAFGGGGGGSVRWSVVCMKTEKNRAEHYHPSRFSAKFTYKSMSRYAHIHKHIRIEQQPKTAIDVAIYALR